MPPLRIARFSPGKSALEGSMTMETEKSRPMGCLIAALFCLLQIVLYIIAFFPDVKQKLVGIGVPVITAIILAIVSGGGSRIEMGLSQALPGEPSFSEEAVITIDDESVASIKYRSPEDGSIFRRKHLYSYADIRDGDDHGHGRR